MNIPAEILDLIKVAAWGYMLFVMQRADRTQREIFRRLRQVELICAANHGLVRGVDEDS